METKPQHAGSQSVALLSCAKLFKRKSNQACTVILPPQFQPNGARRALRGQASHGSYSAAARILHKKQRHVGEFVGTKAFLLNVSLRSTLKEASVCVTRARVFGLQSADGPVYVDPPIPRTLF